MLPTFISLPHLVLEALLDDDSTPQDCGNYPEISKPFLYTVKHRTSLVSAKKKDKRKFNIS